FPGIHVEGGQCAVVMASHVGNYEAPFGDGRHRSAEMRRRARILRGKILAPAQLASFYLITRQDSCNSQSVEPGGVKQGRGFGTLSMPSRRRVYHVGNRI